MFTESREHCLLFLSSGRSEVCFGLRCPSALCVVAVDRHVTEVSVLARSAQLAGHHVPAEGSQQTAAGARQDWQDTDKEVSIQGVRKVFVKSRWNVLHSCLAQVETDTAKFEESNRSGRRQNGVIGTNAVQVATYLLDSYLCEFLWKHRHQNTDLFEQILEDIKALWPPE
ncbi:hypothetical protein J6590_006401 [Homalodisca vitripennis]|nr:hypothetical protein J6590_006401 [Homalodisca vitripennis]